MDLVAKVESHLIHLIVPGCLTSGGFSTFVGIGGRVG